MFALAIYDESTGFEPTIVRQTNDECVSALRDYLIARKYLPAGDQSTLDDIEARIDVLMDNGIYINTQIDEVQLPCPADPVQRADALAIALMATRPDLAPKSLDEWLISYDEELSRGERAAARAILRMFSERGHD